MRGGFVLDFLEALPRGWSARVRVPPDAPLFEGHFPGNPVVPGIALLLLIGDLAAEHAGRAQVPVRLRGVRFRAPLGPGAVLTVGFEQARFTVHQKDGIAVEGEMELEAPAGDLTLEETEETLPSPLLPHRPPALLVTGAGEGRVVACLPARSPLARDGQAPSCVMLEAAAQGAHAAEGSGPAARGGLLVRVSEARFPAATLPLETLFTLDVQADGAAPPLHRFRARGCSAEVAFAVLAS